MPTYQYACTECGHSFEQVQSFTDDSLTVCPVCEGRLRKVYNAVGVVFKGSGFYRNDSRPSGSGESSGGDAGKGGDSSTTKESTGSGEKKAGSSDSSSSGSKTSDTSGSGSSGSGSSSSSASSKPAKPASSPST